MVKLLEKQRQLYKLLEQLLVVIQIVAIFIIFIVSLYWFLELIGNEFLSFMDPVIKVIKDAMIAHFEEELAKGQSGLDGSLFIFIAILGILLYVVSQIKTFTKYQIRTLDKKIIEKREEEQARFNKELQADAKKQIMDYNNIVVLVHVTLKTLLRDVYQTHNDVKHIDKKQEEIVIVALFNLLKNIPGCQFSKDGRTLIITSKNFDNVDTLLSTLNDSINRLKAQLKPRKLSISTNIAIDVYPDRVKVKDIYEDVKTLLQLNMPDEILCYGNFCNRYQYVKTPKFVAYLKGTYDMTEDENVWSLVKKD
ncbi:hypothetical protein IAC76_01610 [Spirochaetes bacterium]|uniref:Uncharacterized protein n=1 Tax=Candidatus Scatousia excrementipullorum TaxID=2840936 RepID=A0A9D9DMZ8_9BACT|nr:hypothetical protein [Candidatus Scatousia excrementipullorum]